MDNVKVGEIVTTDNRPNIHYRIKKVNKSGQ